MLTDWLMVIITAIYVVATIVICYFNGKSAQASKMQTDEMIRQYNLANRPNVTIHFDIVRSGLLCFVIENEGTRPAHNVSVKMNKEFISGIEDDVIKRDRLEKLAAAQLYLASKQRIYVCLGGQPQFSKLAKNIAEIDILYDGYSEHTTIDLNQYGMLLTYMSPFEDISQHLKKMKENDEEFQRNILKQIENKYPIQNAIVHTEMEDEANKYKIFKLVCCEQRVTAGIIADNLGLEREYVLQLLMELEQVDRLIEHCGEMEDGGYFAEWYRR